MTLLEYAAELKAIRSRTNDRISNLATWKHDNTVSQILDLILMNEQTEIAELRIRSNFTYR